VSSLGPTEQLRRIAYLLEREGAPTYRVRAFRHAAATLDDLGPGALAQRRASLTDLPGIGKTTAEVISEALAGKTAGYLQRLEDSAGPLAEGGEEVMRALRGDLHTHSDWSDGGSPIAEMARAASDLGHDYTALTDHSPRLKVARGLTPERLRDQLAIVADLKAELAPFRLLTGIEVDILDDGSLDQEPGLLAELDVVVASVHSKLRMDSASMTRRLVTAISNPHVDVLGHCTGRLVHGRGRPESEFDAELVFAGCARFGVAVEINCRPERLDPPRRLLQLAIDSGVYFSVDTDAHAPGQLEWQPYGAARAQECEVPVGRIVNTWALDDLLAWTARSA
jgi:putative hydrolase